MAQILRKRGHEQLYDGGGWSLFRSAHHRLQKQALACHVPPSLASDELLGRLNEHIPFVKLDRDAYRISALCAKGRALREGLQSASTGARELLDLVRALQALDRETMAWRRGYKWSYATLETSALAGESEVLPTFPEYVHVHADIWSTYEWIHHHTSRIVMHKQLLSCCTGLPL